MALGGVMCVPAGWLADRVGKAQVAGTAMAVGGTAAVATALAFGGRARVHPHLFTVQAVPSIVDRGRLAGDAGADGVRADGRGMGDAPASSRPVTRQSGTSLDVVYLYRWRAGAQFGHAFTFF